jgi:hypothetical protein
MRGEILSVAQAAQAAKPLIVKSNIYSLVLMNTVIN